MTGNRIADAILDELVTRGAAGVSKTDISRLFSGHEPAAGIRAGLLMLERAGKAEPMPGCGHGEQRWRYREAS
jgi:hypothetical protein